MKKVHKHKAEELEQLTYICSPCDHALPSLLPFCFLIPRIFPDLAGRICFAFPAVCLQPKLLMRLCLPS